MPKRLSARQRLAQHMDDRRADLDLRWADVAERAEMTTETLRQARFGEGEIRPLTRRRIERALGWQQGSVTAILNGEDPTPVAAIDVPSQDSDLRHVAAIVNTLTEEEAQRVAQMLQRRMTELKDTKIDKPGQKLSAGRGEVVTDQGGLDLAAITYALAARRQQQ